MFLNYVVSKAWCLHYSLPEWLHKHVELTLLPLSIVYKSATTPPQLLLAPLTTVYHTMFFMCALLPAARSSMRMTLHGIKAEDIAAGLVAECCRIEVYQ